MCIGMLNGMGTNPYSHTNNTAKTEKTNGEFSDAVMTCTAVGSQEVLLCSDALMSYASPQTGESVNIYKAENYSADNPLYIIKGLDANGNEFEQEIDASKINPNRCSYNELMVLNLETGHTSPSDFLHAVVVRNKAGVDSYFDKTDYIAYAQAVLADQKQLGNWESYLAYDKWIQNLMDYVKQTYDIGSESSIAQENNKEKRQPGEVPEQFAGMSFWDLMNSGAGKTRFLP